MGISEFCSTCGASNFLMISYDANGNVASRMDFNDIRACYAYDPARNLEIDRVEGLPATDGACVDMLASPPVRADVRKTTTAWHATFRLPETITAPAPGGGLKTTAYAYDGDGNLTQKTVTAPKNDGSGSNVVRTWIWTYTTLGRVSTAKDRNLKVTTYAYYDAADTPVKRPSLATTQNPLGHVTQITSYDGNGRPVTVVDPNGLETTLTYYPRGWLATRNVGGELTNDTYDGVGQLKQVTMPDGSTLACTYNDAHLNRPGF